MNQKSEIRNQKGFTLIELIITIAVASVLTTIALTLINPLNQIRKAHDSKRKSELRSLQRALEQYYQDFGKYPPNPGTCPLVTSYKIVGLDGFTVEWGGEFKGYSNTLPKDPGGKTYVYFASCDRQAYYLYASLDIATDSSACNAGSFCTSLDTNGIIHTACTGTCNYGVTSSNVSP